MTLTMIHAAVAALLVLAAIFDSKNAKIPNWLIGLFALVFIAQIILLPGSVDLIWQPVFALCVLIAGFGLFATGGFGAGAVKLMAVTALFMPLDRLGMLGLTLVAAVILSLFFFGLLRSMFGSESSSWKVLQSRIIPMAFPIAVTGIIGMFVL
ncbi:prepilin peptidase [Yoonia sp. R2331]|uniref:prepilin peptidase n=1 Tax=Yoonia sp. R2331 TaxID=3237238 RepID=UPI0034E42B73